MQQSWRHITVNILRDLSGLALSSILKNNFGAFGISELMPELCMGTVGGRVGREAWNSVMYTGKGKQGY